MVDMYRNKLADNYKLALSGSFIIVADATYDIIRIPRWALADDVWLDVTTACLPAAATVTIGWKGNGETAQAAGFMSNDIAKPFEVGMKRAQKDNLLSFPGKYFSTAGGTVTVTVAGTLTAGVFQVFVGYSVIC